MDTTGAGVGAGLVGLLLCIILFVIGLVWLIFPFIVNSWLKKIHDQIVQANQETMKTNQLLAQSLANKMNPTPPAFTTLTKKTAIVSIPQPDMQPQTAHISKDGENIGEYSLINVKQMLRNGQLKQQDMYFDVKTQEWTTLDLHPSLY